MASHGPDGAAARDRSPRGRSHDSRGSASGISSTSLSTRSVSASRVRARSVPAASSPTAHRPGVDLRPFALRPFASRSRAPAAQQQTGPQHYNVGTPPQQGPVPTLPQQLPVNPGLDDNTVNLFRQMMQAQDEQIRAQAAQVQQLTNLVKDLPPRQRQSHQAASPLRRAMLGRVQRRASERSLRERTLRCLWLHLPSLSRETRFFGS